MKKELKLEKQLKKTIGALEQIIFQLSGIRIDDLTTAEKNILRIAQKGLSKD